MASSIINPNPFGFDVSLSGFPDFLNGGVPMSVSSHDVTKASFRCLLFNSTTFYKLRESPNARFKYSLVVALNQMTRLVAVTPFQHLTLRYHLSLETRPKETIMHETQQVHKIFSVMLALTFSISHLIFLCYIYPRHVLMFRYRKPILHGSLEWSAAGVV